MSGAVRVEVGSRIEVSREGLPERAVGRLKDSFTHPNPDRQRWLRLGKRGKPPPEHMRTWREDQTLIAKERPRSLSLPRGGWDRVEQVLKGEFGLSLSIKDLRHSCSEDDRRVADYFGRLRLAVEPFDFQARMVEAALESEQGILRGPTGCGKTVVAQAIALRLARPTCVLVPTKKILDDWVERMPREIGVAPGDVGVIQGSRRRIRPITVALVHSYAARAEEYAGAFDALLFDEVWRAAAATFYRAVDTSRARYRVGFSADERRKDRKEFLIYDVFGELLVDVPRKDLIAAGTILDTEVRLVPTEFDAPWYRDLSPERRQDGQVFQRLVQEMSRDERRNRLIVDLALEELHAGCQVLAFAHRVEHCALLRADVNAVRPCGGVVVGDGQGFEDESARTLAGMRDGTCRFAAGTYGSIGAGVNLPAVSRGIACTPIHTNRGFFGQVRGRLCRVDRAGGAKADSVLYVPWDRLVHGLAPLRAMVRWNRAVNVLDAGAWRPGRDVLRELEAAEREDES
jgi:superfamily II DNA or RNA helicase